MIVTVGIKALNEEANIAACLESAVRAVHRIGGEVILADSGSTDRTIEIARSFPVHIVQLADTAERCCGAGAQLAFQHAKGDYFYMLDGDMVLNPGFIPVGIAYLEANPDAAGVGGRIVERNLEGEDFQIRAKAAEGGCGLPPRIVDRLDCGGLYRTSAIREVGHFADRNLHAFEEFELAARLRSREWTLARIDHHAIDHYGHTAGGYRLLWRRLVSGYAGGPGEVLRAALGRRHLPIVLRRLSHLRYGVAVTVWWMLLGVVAFALPSLVVVLIAVPLLFLSVRRGSLSLGVYSLASWNVTACGLLMGLVRSRVPASSPVRSVDRTETAVASPVRSLTEAGAAQILS